MSGRGYVLPCDIPRRLLTVLFDCCVMCAALVAATGTSDVVRPLYGHCVVECDICIYL